MATRKDLLKAHSFTTQRLVSALVDRDPDAAVSPLRRITTATFVSVLIGVIALAGTFLIGKLRPGLSSDWQDSSVVIQDMDAGVLFVYNDQAKALQPMANITSARLKVGEASGTAPQVRQVSSKLLKGTPQLQRQGIPGAPYQLPSATDIQPYPLRSCAAAPRRVANGTTTRPITLEIGDLTASTDDAAVVAQLPDGTQYVVFHGTAHKLWAETGASSPLVEGLPVAEVPPAWLASLPLGAPIDPIVVPNLRGKPTRGIAAGLQVGDLAQVGATDSPDVRHYIQLDQGLARISYLDMRLWEHTAKVGTPRMISEGELAEAVVQDHIGTSGLPWEKPVGPSSNAGLQDRSVCATYHGGERTTPTISVGVETPALPNDISISGTKADVIDMPNLSGALLQNDKLTGTETASFLVYRGMSYGIPTGNARRALGYDKDVPLGRVPAGLISLIPNGLDEGRELSTASMTVMP
ncbi:type VII secretion protein EccB [Aestuariimicrobium ganziense]|uniref:type VII secretion protein EccB n=1 Tax=Aestuariimicrobium ganziense TaxID=2773677 RepID=UPI00194362EE|nr:type VII secretion protein EccB [Aestuariimicrobium ganziense]